MALTLAQKTLLNNFPQTQPGLNEAGKPGATSGVQLGDIISALEQAVAANPPEVSDVVYGAGWNGDLTHAPSKNAVYDKIESVIATIPTLPTMNSATTSAIGEITLASMTATGAVLVTPIADPGNDIVFSHVICEAGKITVYVKDASAVSPIAATAANALTVAYLVIKNS